VRAYDERPGVWYPEVIDPINELTIAEFYGWSLPTIRALSIVDFGNALGFIRGTNKAKSDAAEGD
jgi:hypothetical protein